MNRKEFLEEAEKCVCGRREEDYGSPEDNFSTIAEFWTTYLNAQNKLVEYNNGTVGEITAHDVAAMMALLKVSRIVRGNTIAIDSYIDLAGYAACAGEIATSPKNVVDDDDLSHIDASYIEC